MGRTQGALGVMVSRIAFHRVCRSVPMHMSEELLVFDSAQFKDENGHDGKKENGRG